MDDLQVALDNFRKKTDALQQAAREQKQAGDALLAAITAATMAATQAHPQDGPPSVVAHIVHGPAIGPSSPFRSPFLLTNPID